MLKLVSFCFKLAFFSVVILILGNTLHWNGKTISDQVKLKMSHAEHSPLLDTMRTWAEKITHDSRQGIQLKTLRAISPERGSLHEEIPSSERQKLKALIQELNSSHKEN